MHGGMIVEIVLLGRRIPRHLPAIQGAKIPHEGSRDLVVACDVLADWLAINLDQQVVGVSRECDLAGMGLSGQQDGGQKRDDEQGDDLEHDDSLSG